MTTSSSLYSSVSRFFFLQILKIHSIVGKTGFWSLRFSLQCLPPADLQGGKICRPAVEDHPDPIVRFDKGTLCHTFHVTHTCLPDLTFCILPPAPVLSRTLICIACLPSDSWFCTDTGQINIQCSSTVIDKKDVSGKWFSLTSYNYTQKKHLHRKVHWQPWLPLGLTFGSCWQISLSVPLPDTVFISWNQTSGAPITRLSISDSPHFASAICTIFSRNSFVKRTGVYSWSNPLLASSSWSFFGNKHLKSTKHSCFDLTSGILGCDTEA